MVKIIAYNKAQNNRKHNTLVLQGELEFIPSKTEGRYYAIAAICSISCTFNEVLCAGLVGKTLPGSLEKMECAPYEHPAPNSDEVLTLTHTWYYSPTPRTIEQCVFPERTAA
ncbi:hypothetical protein [Rufibacter tibetensis]|uniref:hypothetical protein n=1 Tax=Rufibacter tibetensis TaxID=512763 RepID=UPI000A8D7925|nr:hypothetical protein [Rufibacter tibetensis]